MVSDRTETDMETDTTQPTKADQTGEPQVTPTGTGY